MERPSEFTEIYTLYDAGSYERALTLLETVDASPEKKAVMRGRILLAEGEYQQSLNLLEEALTNITDESLEIATRLYIIENVLFLEQNDIAEILLKDLFSHYIDFVPTTDVEQRKFTEMFSMWLRLSIKLMEIHGNTEKGEKYCNKLTELLNSEYFDNQIKFKIDSYNTIGNFYARSKNWDFALKTYLKSLELNMHLHNPKLFASSYNNLGTVYLEKGDYTKALDYFHKALDSYKQLKLKSNIASVSNNIGLLYEQTFDLELAEEFLEMSLTLNQSLGKKASTANTLNNLAKVYYKKGNYGYATELLEKALELEKNENVPAYSSESLFILILIAFEKRNRIAAKQYYAQMIPIANDFPKRKHIQERYELATAILYRLSTRIISQANAQLALREYIKKPYLTYEYRTMGLVQLSDLLLIELKSTDESEEVLTELLDVVYQLFVMANEHQNIYLLVHVKLIQAKLALYESNIKHSKEFLDEALELARKKQIPSLHKKVLKQQEIFNSEVHKWEAIISENSDIVDATNQTDIINYMREVIKDL